MHRLRYPILVPIYISDEPLSLLFIFRI